MAAIRDKAKKFKKFVTGLHDKYGSALLEGEPPLLDRFVFYLLLYSNPVTHARKAYKALIDDKRFASWNEVRVSTVREISEVLDENKIAHSYFLAQLIKHFLQKIFEEVDDTVLETFRDKERYKADQARNYLKGLPDLLAQRGREIRFPEWGITYLLTGLGLDSQMPWDKLGYTENALAEQKVFPAKATLTQKKRVAKALLEGLDDLGPLDVHHLLVEYGKRGGR